MKHVLFLFQDAINGHLFLIKHLLILREQIAPFDVDFAVKEMSLDFSKMKTAAYGLWSHSNRLFALSSSNAILEFLLDVSEKCCLVFVEILLALRSCLVSAINWTTGYPKSRTGHNNNLLFSIRKLSEVPFPVGLICSQSFGLQNTY